MCNYIHSKTSSCKNFCQISKKNVIYSVNKHSLLASFCHYHGCCHWFVAESRRHTRVTMGCSIYSIPISMGRLSPKLSIIWKCTSKLNTEEPSANGIHYSWGYCNFHWRFFSRVHLLLLYCPFRKWYGVSMWWCPRFCPIIIIKI